MAKYSTNKNHNVDTGFCEICGKQARTKKVIFEGRKTSACEECLDEYDLTLVEENNKNEDEDENKDEEPSSDDVENKETESDKNSENIGYTINRLDSSWVEESRKDYQNAKTPYLVQGYSETVKEKREKVGLSIEELAEKARVRKDAIEALESKDAFVFGIPESEIERIEEILDIELKQ